MSDDQERAHCIAALEAEGIAPLERVVQLLMRERAAARAPVEAEVRDLKLRVDLDALGNHERDAVELVELRAKHEALRAEIAKLADGVKDFGPGHNLANSIFEALLRKLLEAP